MSNKQVIERVITTDRAINEVWNGLLTPDPFPGNLFISDETTYVCYPLGTGRIGGYRFEYGNHKWLIVRLSSADIEAQTIKWDLVDIKKSAVKKLDVKVRLLQGEGQTKVHITTTTEYSFGANLFKFIHNRKLKNRLATFAI